MTTSCQFGMFSFTHLVPMDVLLVVSQVRFMQERIDGGASAPDHARLSPQVVNGNFEETLDLRSVQVHRDDVIATGDLKHVGDEFGGDRRSRLVFSVLRTEQR